MGDFQWRADLSEITFDKRAYQAAIKKQMTENIREAGRKWLARVLVIIPTWSRASRATFEALAQAVGFNITYGPQRSREDRLVLGLQTGRGGLVITKDSWHFTYETDLRYLAYNEFTNAVPGPPPQPFGRLRNPTPYHFQDAGLQAFLEFAQTVQLPNPLDFIKPNKI